MGQNGRAFLFEGDGLFEVQQFAMSHYVPNLWAATNESVLSLRIRGAILSMAPADDVIVASNLKPAAS